VSHKIVTLLGGRAFLNTLAKGRFSRGTSTRRKVEQEERIARSGRMEDLRKTASALRLVREETLKKKEQHITPQVG